MGRRRFNQTKMPRVSRENEGKVFTGLRTARLGTEKNPACLRVRDSERAEELRAVCEHHAWQCSITVDPETPEDISDLERLLHPSVPIVHDTTVGRNEACSCGSGIKFKKCCAP